MPTLDDALDQALGKPVSNPLIAIDHTQKVFTLPQDFGKAGVRGDDNGRRIYFEMPYEMDEIAPYSEHTTVEIQYKNAMGETGRYQVPKSEVMDNTNRNYTCSFPIPATLTKYEGEAEIQLCLRTDDGKKEWHISPVKVMIGPFFDCEVITEDDPKYDIVAQLMDKVTRLESVITGDEQISLMDYLTKTEASRVYVTSQTLAQSYLTKAEADTTFLKKDDEGYNELKTRVNNLETKVQTVSPLYKLDGGSILSGSDSEMILVFCPQGPGDLQNSITLYTADTGQQTIDSFNVEFDDFGENCHYAVTLKRAAKTAGTGDVVDEKIIVTGGRGVKIGKPSGSTYAPNKDLYLIQQGTIKSFNETGAYPVWVSAAWEPEFTISR